MISALVVVPTYNEADNLGGFTRAVLRQLPDTELLIVDDASPDGTGRLADEIARREPRVHALHRPVKLGLGSAYVTGFGWGLERGYQRFFEMDADFSHDPAYLPAFTAALDEGNDVVVGSRNVSGGAVEGWGVGRHLLSKGGSLYSRSILGLQVHDMTTGYKAYTRQALERLDIQSIRSNGYAFQIETTYRAVKRGLRVLEIPIVFVDRRVGKSKMSGRDAWEAVTAVWRMRFGSEKMRDLRAKP